MQWLMKSQAADPGASEYAKSGTRGRRCRAWNGPVAAWLRALRVVGPGTQWAVARHASQAAGYEPVNAGLHLHAIEAARGIKWTSLTTSHGGRCPGACH